MIIVFGGIFGYPCFGKCPEEYLLRGLGLRLRLRALAQRALGLGF